MISPEQLPLVTAAAGLLIGIFLTWLIVTAKNKAGTGIAAEKLRAEQQRGEEAMRDLEQLESRFTELQGNESALREAQVSWRCGSRRRKRQRLRSKPCWKRPNCA